jgi:hypothetical protein
VEVEAVQDISIEPEARETSAGMPGVDGTEYTSRLLDALERSPSPASLVAETFT